MSHQDILHPCTMPKVCFAVGESSGALSTHCNVALDGIQDIQLSQYAACQWLQRSNRDRDRDSLEMYQEGCPDVCSRGAGLEAWAGRHTSRERGLVRGLRRPISGIGDPGVVCARDFVLARVAGHILVVS